MTDKTKFNRRDNMSYKFNEDQINIIQHCLDIQEEIWSKNKSNREYYDADLRRLEECKDIINHKRTNGWTPKIVINTPKQAPVQNQLGKKTLDKMMEYIKNNSAKSLKELIKKFYKK